MKLSKKMVLSFVAAIILSIIIISTIANFMINREFDSYLINEQKSNLEMISDDINKIYIANGYKLTEEDLHNYISSKNLNITVQDDLSGNTLKCHNLNRGKGQGQGHRNNQEHNMHNNNNHSQPGCRPNRNIITRRNHGNDSHNIQKDSKEDNQDNSNIIIDNEDNKKKEETSIQLEYQDTDNNDYLDIADISENYDEIEFKLKDPNSKDILGSMTIGYINDGNITESAILFKDTLSKSFAISAIATIIIGIMISIFLSRTLTSPILNITNTANKIQEGDLDAKSNVKTNVLEIKELSNSINYLGNTLSKQEEIRSQYASDISHELRTPLTTLKSHLEAIIDGVWKPNKENLTILLDETNRLSGLVDDLRVSFKGNEKDIDMNKVDFNLSTELNDLVKTYRPIYQKNKFKIYSDIEEDIFINMDKDNLKQIINNLLSNSIRYIDNEKEQGYVNISLIERNDYGVITIEDNGIGIKEEDLKSIFDRFYRVDSSRNKNTGGTGLGLSIVKTIVENHNGSIDIKSKYKSGTQFTIKLPLK